jgi:hypothetical protein
MLYFLSRFDLKHSRMFKRIQSAWTSLTFPLWTAPLALLLAVILSYGLRLPALGFYWDDWPYLWFFHIAGPAGMYNSLGADRPLLGVLYALTLGLLGNQNPLAWQIFALLFRWLCALGFWLALRQAWPRQQVQTFSAAVLFAVFPAFTQHWISVVWGNAYVLYAFLFFSLALTTWAVQQPRRLWWALPAAFALSAFTLFSTEYFFGLELLRPLLAWFALAGLASRPRLRRAFFSWLPFLALMAGFAVWRSLYHPFGGGGSEGLLSALFDHPIEFLTRLPGRILQDTLQAFMGAWGLAFNYAPLIENSSLLYAVLALLVGLAFWLYLARVKNENVPGRWALEACLFGLFAFLAAGWPIWLTNLPYTASFPWDRFALVFAPGVCLATAGLLSWLGKTAARRAFLVALLVGLSSGVNNAGAAAFRQDWNAAASLFWQLSWRAPAIHPGTALLSDQLGLRYFEDDSLAAPLNWMYVPNEQNQRMEYHFLNIPERMAGLGYLKADYPVVKDFRVVSFTGSTSQAVVVLYNPPGCLQVLDPQRDAWRADLPEYARRALPLSRPELILAQPPAGQSAAIPPAGIFGPEPKHKWCFFYAQAELARQSEDWNAVLRLQSQSIGAGYYPQDPAEYLPFVEASLRYSVWADAIKLTKRAYDASAGSSAVYCALWQRAAAWTSDPAGYQAAQAAIRAELHCTE